MGKVAFVFDGQGAQHPGMGQEIFEASPAARAVFELADRVRPGTSAQCFAGTKEELSQTVNTQPCVFAVDLACAAALEEAGIRAEGAAGFSLGEIAGLAQCGILSQENAFSLVCRRAELMEQCTVHRKGGMMAILGLETSTVEQLCKEAGAYPVNYNCPGQLVAAGEAEAISALQKLVRASGGKAVRLAVSGAFHSPLMSGAADDLTEELKQYSLNPPSVPLYSNKTALPYGEDPAALIAGQVKSPVLWQKTVENMMADGFDTFVEVGPGTTLCGLIRKISEKACAVGTENRAGLESAVQTVGGKYASE